MVIAKVTYQNVIGLCGYPGSGKTALRKILVDEIGYVHINSKELLYKIASDVTGCAPDAFSNPYTKNKLFKGHEFREYPGRIGEAIEGLLGQDYLIRKALEEAEVEKNPKTLYVIDSLRMRQNELLFNDINVIEICKDEKTNKFVFDDYNKYYIHMRIQNDGSLRDLKVQACELTNAVTKGMGCL